MEENGNFQLGLLAKRIFQLSSNVKTCLSLSMDANVRVKNYLTLSYAADNNDGDKLDVAVDTITSISRDFDEVTKVPKEKVRNA